MKNTMRHSFSSYFGMTQQQWSHLQAFQTGLISLASSVLGTVCFLGAGVSAQAAETVSAKYAALELELSVLELQSYAESGEMSPLVETLDILLKDDQREQVKSALTRKFELSPEVLARFFSTPSGYRVLEELADVVQAKSESVDSVLALRTALILTASESNSTTLLSLLKAFPDQGVQLDLAEGAKIFAKLDAQLEAHETAIEQIKQRSVQASAKTSKAIAHQFSKRGPLNWDKKSFTLQDERPVRLQVSDKPRTFPLDLYLPRTSGASPVVILSHGLGSGQTAYQYFAEHLASYGYVVAVPEHPGSSYRHWQELLENKTHLIAQPTEFINRPLDIQYILDVLTMKNQTDPELMNRFDLDRVGMFGHSYGGYTALAIAGAKLNPQALQETCQQDLIALVNPSLLLQCQAIQLKGNIPEVSDDRVKAIFVTHPFLSQVVGADGLGAIQVPVAFVAGGADRIAPLVPEQFEPYSKITGTQDRTFILVERAEHLSQIGEISAQESVFEMTEVATDPVILKARETLKTMGLAFFQTRLHSHDNAKPTLLELARSLNEPNFPVYGFVGEGMSWSANVTP